MVHTGLAINKLEQGTENTFRGRDDNATVLQELSEQPMQERATGICHSDPADLLSCIPQERATYNPTLKFLASDLLSYAIVIPQTVTTTN